MRDFNQQNTIPTRLVDTYSRYIDSPVQRLKFLDSLMKIETGRRKAFGRLLERVPFIGTLRYRALMGLEVARLVPANKTLPFSFRFAHLLYKARLAVYAVCLIATLGIGAGMVYLFARVAGNLSISTEAKSKALNGSAPAAGRGSGAPVAVGKLGAGPALDRVWLADRGDGYEFYSNGARVLTDFETAGVERKFYQFHFDKQAKSFEPVLATKPVGIVFHISESDKLPFMDQYNSSIQVASKALLDYARAKKLYNYVIDRFGRIYRIVGDEYPSNHAGYSVWGNNRDFYVNLNASFIGVCFEGRSLDDKAVGPDGINEAQIHAARVLTAVLRSKYGIDDENCVTHGLVSVNPSNRLMGYHTDWVSGFPFEAVGLTDKYKSELIAISEFGFSYDASYVSSAGGVSWPGLELSDAKIRAEAKADAETLGNERAARREIFRKAFEMQHALDTGREGALQAQDADREPKPGGD